VRTLRIPSPRPELSEDVTRLWIGPEFARVGVVLGRTIQENAVVLCWDTAAGRVLWQADLQYRLGSCPDPDFDRDLTQVVYPVVTPEIEYDDPDERVDSWLYYLGIRPIDGGKEARLGIGEPQIPAFTPDGRTVLSPAYEHAAGFNEVRRWTIVKGKPTGRRVWDQLVPPNSGWVIDFPGDRYDRRNVQPTVLAVSPDGRFVACGCYSGLVCVWKLVNRRRVATITPPKPVKHYSKTARRLAFSRDGTRLAVLHEQVVKKQVGFAVSVWAIPGGELQKGPAEKVSVNGVAFSPDGRTLLTARDDGKIGVWDVATWKLRREYAWKIGKLFCVAFSPDGLTCAAGGEKGQVVVWDVDS
jgi:hypothetical protein